MKDDVPSGIDLRVDAVAQQWAAEADVKRPWRAGLRGAIAERLASHQQDPLRVLELGSGPGLLAEQILLTCVVAQYTLLDFSPPMLELSRARMRLHPAATFALVDFKQPGWTQLVPGAPFDAVVTMQAVHELRHKRHASALYAEVHGLLRVGGLLVVCDHAPPDDGERSRSLHATLDEQHVALGAAGFATVSTLCEQRGLYVCVALRD